MLYNYIDSNGYMQTGWIYDSGNWFYLYGDGSMAHDCYIGNYYVDSNGAWTNSIPTSNSSSYTGSSTSTSNNKSAMVYVASSGNGKKYHSNPNCSRMKGTIHITLSEAQAEGYTACKKCY